MSATADIHGLPLASRVVDDVVRAWLDTQLGLAEAAMDTDDKRQAVIACRWLHLAGYSYQVTPRILDALRRAGLLIPEPEDTP